MSNDICITPNSRGTDSWLDHTHFGLDLPVLFKMHKMCQIWSVDSKEVIKTVVTRCQILRLKCIKFDLGWGSAPDPAGELTATTPDSIAAFKGPTFKGKEEMGREGE